MLTLHCSWSVICISVDVVWCQIGSLCLLYPKAEIWLIYVCKFENVGRKLLKTMQIMTTFRNPLAGPLGTRRGPQFEKYWSGWHFHICSWIGRMTALWLSFWLIYVIESVFIVCWCRRSRSRSSSRDLERVKRERGRERRAKGLPPFKEEHLISKFCFVLHCCNITDR